MPTVLLTRAATRTNDEFTSILRKERIDVVEIPLIDFSFPKDLRDLDSALRKASEGNYDFLLFSSPTGVEFFEKRSSSLDLLEAMRRSLRAGAVGETTASALTKLGITITFPIPDDGGSDNFLRLLKNEDVAGKNILLLQSQIGLDTLAHGLKDMGANVERVTLYVTLPPNVEDASRLHLLMQNSPPDVIAFFSPSAVHNFSKIVAHNSNSALAAIGETTAKAIYELLGKRPEIHASKTELVIFASEIVGFLKARSRTIK